LSAVETAYAKLNLALHVRRRREDGYHDIETVFAFCVDGDELSGEAADELSVAISGPFARDVPLDAESLVIKAAHALQMATVRTDGAKLHLVKNLPVASGIGGGSADAAATLRLLTRLWKIEPAWAERVAPSLGADVPACLHSRTSFGTGAGDQLQPVDDSGLAGTPALLVNPALPLSTGAVFARWDGQDGGPLDDWREGGNDLEAPATALVPEIAEVLEWLRNQPGADSVRMSGSGATCFALFNDEAARDEAAAAVPGQWWRLATTLR
jgi:4-diphosphocytidyl-2-C-methyl-D-erythritol kinase